MSNVNPRTSRSRHLRAALLAIPLAAGILGATVTPARAATGPASLTCGGVGVDPAVKVRYRTEALIKAPLSTIWNLQTDVERWPSWQQEAVTTVKRLDPGPFRKHSQFQWTSPVPPNPASPPGTLVITSTVQQLRHNECVRWTGPADSEGLHIDGVHVWTFTKVHGGVLVRTEETHTGPQVDANVPLATKLLGDGLEAWLKALKTTAETGHCNQLCPFRTGH
jgi:uncharacterized protein YndB with AHSA1/START domain